MIAPFSVSAVEKKRHHQPDCRRIGNRVILLEEEDDMIDLG